MLRAARGELPDNIVNPEVLDRPEFPEARAVCRESGVRTGPRPRTLKGAGPGRLTVRDAEKPELTAEASFAIATTLEH